MTWFVRMVIVLVGAVILAVMLHFNPGYNDAFRPYVTLAASQEAGRTRLFGARFTGWQTADQVVFSQSGRAVRRDSDGVFLQAEMDLSATTQSLSLRARWRGASGREYAATKRISGVPRQIDEIWLQPGLSMRAMAIFELPPDEIAGGSLLLTVPLDPPQEGALRLMPPNMPPSARAVMRFE